MSETKFNAELRAVLRAQGLRALHIREADQPGVADLVIWQGRQILAWAELKVGDHVVEPQQWQFLEDRKNEGGKSFIIRLYGEYGVHVAEAMGYGQLTSVETHPDFRKVRWARIFQ